VIERRATQCGRRAVSRSVTANRRQVEFMVNSGYPGMNTHRIGVNTWLGTGVMPA
jgi:hypothetical protein